MSVQITAEMIAATKPDSQAYRKLLEAKRAESDALLGERPTMKGTA